MNRRRSLSSILSLSALVSLTAPSPGALASPFFLSRPLIDAIILQTDEAEREYNDGVQAYRAGNYDQAISHFANAVKIRPRFGDAYYNLGLTYEAKNDPKDAIDSFTKVFVTKQRFVPAWIERAKNYAALGAFDKAQADFAQALTIRPNDPDVFSARGDAYFQQKQYDLAAADYNACLKYAAPSSLDPITYYNLGAVSYAGGHYDAAVTAFNAFIAAKPADLADTYSFLGDSYSAKKDDTSAIGAYTKYITAHPADPTGSALKGRALAYLQAKEYAKSVADYTQYLAAHPKDKEALNNKIVAIVALNNAPGKVPSSDLLTTLKTAVENDAANMPLRATLAATEMKANDFAGAIVQYNIILQAHSTDSDALFNRGVAYGQQKDYPKAAADFGAYTKVKPEDGAGWNNLGIFLGQQKDYKGAITAFTQYITLKPADKDFVDVYKNRGIAYYNVAAVSQSAADYKTALSDLMQYDKAKPGDPDVPTLIADCTEKSGGDVIEARKAVTLSHPTDPDAWFFLGSAYLNKKDNANAIAAFTKSYSLKADPQTLFNRGLAYLNAGEFTKAEADSAAAIAAKADYSDAFLLKADAEYDLKKADAAAADYEKYTGIASVSSENKLYAYKRMLQAYLDTKNFVKMVTLTSSLIQMYPTEPQNYFLRGAAYDAQQNFESAIPDLVKYTSMSANDAIGFYNLGAAYAGKKDNSDAAVSFEKASTLKPDYFDAANQAATAYKLVGDADQADATKCAAEYDKAVALYDKAAAITSATSKQQTDALYNEAAALEAKAKALDSSDPLKAAITVWNKWVNLSPTDIEVGKIKQHIQDLQAKVAKDGG